MKLSNYNWSRQIEIKENEIPLLIVEDKKHLRDIIKNLNAQIKGEEGPFALSVDNKLLKLSNSLKIMSFYIDFDLNDKRILNKIYDRLKDKALEDNESFSKISGLITEYIQTLIYDEEINLEQEQSVDLVDIFKGLKIGVESNEEDEIEDFLNYIRLLEDYLNIKLFIFINLEEYYKIDELKYIYDVLLLNKTKFILLQNTVRNVMDKREKRYIIDEDLCEL
ncbi:MAG: type II-A CRISPR-associated protein Csn2 [Clostridiales bacterium]|nr:type II-A CRISPR-associated protein Csn2 [Clostridiales bacterium]